MTTRERAIFFTSVVGRSAGLEICGEASTNSEVLQKCIELQPDVLVKDWVMPGESNLEVTKDRQPTSRHSNHPIALNAEYPGCRRRFIQFLI
jgi:DNA-binding NarL/FixJ family response regulator